MTDQPKFTIKLENKNPIELQDFTKSMNALSRQYQRYVRLNEDVKSRNDTKLVITSLKTGSIIADLAPIAQDIGQMLQGVAPYAEDAKKVIGFAKQFKDGIDALRAGKKPYKEATTRDIKDYKEILEPTSKEIGSAFSFQATGDAKQFITVNINQAEADSVQVQAAKQIERMKEPEQQVFKKRMLNWETASRGKSGNRSGRAVIDTIDERALPVIIEDDEIRDKMIVGRENPFLVGFVVDVELLSVDGQVKAYNVTKLHGVVEGEAQEELEEPQPH